MRPAQDLVLRCSRVIGLAGLAALALITLVDQGATRMYATPWTFALACALACPPLALALRCASSTPLRLPNQRWLGLATLVAVVPLASAWLSPYRAPSLWQAAIPFAAACVFLLVHDWLQENRSLREHQLAYALALAASAVVLASTVYWLEDLRTLTKAELFSSTPFQMRNPHPLGHSNYTAGLMLLGLPWLGLAAARNKGIKHGAAVAGALLALIALFTSGSRGGLIGLVVLLVCAIAASRPGWKRFSLFACVALGFAALLAVANPRVRSFLSRPDPMAKPNIGTVQRAAMIEAGALMGDDRPWLGWGPGTTPFAYPRYRAQLEGGAENVLQLHNTPVNLWAELGGAGVVTGLLSLALVLASWARSPVAAVTLAGYAAFSLTDYQLDIPVFAFAIGAMAAVLAAPGSSVANSTSRASIAGLALGMLAIIGIFGGRDRAAILNAEALIVANETAQTDRAIALLHESLALNPDQEIAHFNLGWLLVVRDPAAAENHFRTAAHLVPDKGGVYFGLGLALLNQGHTDQAARVFALECINDPAFLGSPWWSVPAVAAQSDAARAQFATMVRWISDRERHGWPAEQAELLRKLAPQLGRATASSVHISKRERTGYAVLMRNSDLGRPIDVFAAQENPAFAASLSFPLPPKGWVASPLLIELLDAPASTRQ